LLAAAIAATHASNSRRWQIEMPRSKTSRKRLEAVLEVDVLKVRAGSDPNKVAGAIAGAVRESPTRSTQVQTIGAAALNQAVKALAIARGYVAPQGLDLWCYPAFVDAEIDGAERTAIRLFIGAK